MRLVSFLCVLLLYIQLFVYLRICKGDATTKTRQLPPIRKRLKSAAALLSAIWESQSLATDIRHQMSEVTSLFLGLAESSNKSR